MELDGLWIDGHGHRSERLALVSGYVDDVVLLIGEHKLQREKQR